MTAIAETARLTESHEEAGLVLRAAGPWTVRTVIQVDDRLRAIKPPADGRVIVDLSELERLDTIGAMLLCRVAGRLMGSVGQADFRNVHPDQKALIDRVSETFRPCEIAPPQRNAAVVLLERMGAALTDVGLEVRALLGFFGVVLTTLGDMILHPRKLRLTSLVFHMEQVGLNAMPIICLISFLIGVVLAFQGADQLQRFGAEVFVVNLISVTVLREMGILLTAIIVAGRSGSAFTAQIGSMKVNEEIDAIRTLGLDPIQVLVAPRVLALLIMLPLLGFVADIMGLFGGGLMAWVALDVSPGQYLERLNQVTAVSHFWVGISKAPAFAVIIALIGCFQGLQVRGSAESVGQLTTKAVVQSIFMVIVVDAAFSIFYAAMGI